MAAILCTTIGDLIGKCCQSLTKPCEYCSQGCSKGCNELGKMLCTPFAPYIVCTLALNTPAVVYALKSLSIGDFECSFPLFRWLIVNAAFALAHMFAAFYIASIIQAPKPQAPTISAVTGLNSPQATEEGRAAAIHSNFTPMPNDLEGGANSFKRIKHVLCYDKGMAIYILVFLAWVVWMALGVSRRLFVEDYYGDDCDGMLSYMSTAITCGYVYMFMVSVTFCCSLVCLR